MRSLHPIYALLLIAALLVAGCAARRGAEQDAAKPAAKPYTHTTSPRYRYLYTEATRQKLMGNHSAAIDLMQHCADIDPDVPEAIYELALYRRALRQDSLALAYLHRAAALDPSNTQYIEALASYYLDANNEDSALAYVERLAELQPRRTDVLSRLVGLYGAAGRPADAIRTLYRIELLEGKMPQVSLRKFQLYKSLDRTEEAYAELEALCREFPHELNYRISIANELIDDGRTDEALDIFEQVRRQDPTNSMLMLSTMLYYRKSGQDSLFHAMRDSLLFHAKTPSDIRVNLMRDYINEVMQDDTAATARASVEQMFDSVGVATTSDLSLLQLRVGYLMTYDKDNDSAYVATLERMIAVEPTNRDVLFSLILAYSHKQDFERLENVCRRGVVTNPEELVCHYYLGMALYQQDKHEEALRAFQAGIVQKTEESKPDMVGHLFSLVGDMYHEMGRKQEAYAAYDSCLVYQEDNAMCLNNYAYFLSLDDTDLDRAEEMSYRSLRIDPDNKTYLDTYAWILFMKERYAEAQRYIDRVCPPDSTDSCLLADVEVSGVVFEHAGDIAAHVGNMAQAVRFWRLAEKAGGQGLTAVLPKKIKQRKYLK